MPISYRTPYETLRPTDGTRHPVYQHLRLPDHRHIRRMDIHRFLDQRDKDRSITAWNDRILRRFLHLLHLHPRLREILRSWKFHNLARAWHPYNFRRPILLRIRLLDWQTHLNQLLTGVKNYSFL